MAERNRSWTWNHPVVKLFVIIAVVASMSLAAEVLRPLAVAVLLAFALSSPARFFERKRLPRVPSVLLTVTLALGALGGVGYVVYSQVNLLAADLPQYQDNIKSKLRNLFPQEDNNLEKAQKAISEAVEDLDEPKLNPDVRDVRVVERPSFRDRLSTAVGPYLEIFGVGTFVLILVTFMLIGREDLSDRIVQLFGRRQITITTRTMEDVGQRISRYLGMYATVNSLFGFSIGLGLWAIQVPYAVLWGFLAGLLRFIPYVGPAVAFGLPLLFTFAETTGLWQPLSVVALFLVAETILNSIEPIIYGRTTGVSALSLLVAAMFWTWLWGLVGLAISTPITVCLAVLGKYAPSLSFFSTLLGEEAGLEQDVRVYQRLLALDEDGAEEIVEELLRERPKAEVFDTILIPVLSKAERDFARGEIDEREQAFIWRVVGQIVDDLEDQAELDLESVTGVKRLSPEDAPEPSEVVGIASADEGDVLVLRMLRQLLKSAGCPMELVTDAETPLEVSEAVAEREPKLVLLSYLPPVGLTSARYLVRKIRARNPDLKVLVARWGERGRSGSAEERLGSAGASQVLFSLTESRMRILDALAPAEASPVETETETAPAT